jgi:protein SDA1
MMMNFISRLIGHHKLFVENFYPFVINYMHPKQEHITYILAILCQACHDLVAPDTLEPVIRVLSMNFVSDRCSPEVGAIG